MKCKVVSLTESVTITWEKHGHVIKEEQFSKRGENFVVSDLLVDIVDETDFGGFRCIAENDVGLSVKNIELEKRGNQIIQDQIGIFFIHFRGDINLNHPICGHRDPLHCDPFTCC